MAQWGRNDQAVTANSSTTKETSNGAPIGTYTAVRAGGGANAHFGNTSAGSRAATDVAMFNNTTPSAFLSGAAVGVFGVDKTEIAVSNAAGIAHAGWNLRRAGTGSIIAGVYSNNGVGYNNADILVVKSPVAGGNATFSMSTNATGGNVALTLTNAGFGFNVVSIPTSNLAITNATGGTAAGNTNVTSAFTVTAGGRAGRVHYETLVAMGSLGAQTAAYGTAALVADASDDTILPDS